jgi:hypothetical protein
VIAHDDPLRSRGRPNGYTTWRCSDVQDRQDCRDGTPLRGLSDLAEYELSLSVHRPDAHLISALRGWGLEEVMARIEEILFEEAAGVTDRTKRAVP